MRLIDTKDAKKNTANAKTLDWIEIIEFKIPKVTIPTTNAIFSVTSKKLKYEAVSTVLGNILEYVDLAKDWIAPITKPIKAPKI